MEKKTERNKVNPINLIPWMIGVFASLILIEQVSYGLCYNKAVFDGIVFLLVCMAMLKGREVVSTVLLLILLCCFASFCLYFFPTHVSDFDVPSLLEIAAFSLFVCSFYDRRYARWIGRSILVLSLTILIIVLFEINDPMLRSYSPIVAFTFIMMGAWLIFKKENHVVRI